MEVDIGEVKELLSVQGLQSVLVAGDYHTLVPLLGSLPPQLDIFCLTYLGHNGPLRPGDGMRPVLQYQSDAGRLALLKRVTNNSVVSSHFSMSYYY